MATEPASQVEPRPLGEFSRLTGVFFEPGKTFTDIAERPAWFVPVVLAILVGIVYLYTFSVHIGWRRYIVKTMDANPRIAQLTAEQRQRAVDLQLRFAPLAGYAGQVVAVPVYYLVTAGILMGIIKGLLGVPLRFRQTFAVMSYASFLPRAIAVALSIAVMWLKNPDDFDLQNPILSNPGALMSPDTPHKFLYSLAGSMDVFSIWTILLIAVGLKAAGGKRLSFGGALFAIVLPWAVYVLCRAAIVSIFNAG
ncbi:MAG TPA: YIP1 family protein [Bryobacteraceae bacterium]|nr:YIP1 family protein [Bryobacteraceae bacterium]